MKAIKLEVGKIAQVVDIEDTLESLQHEVKGWVLALKPYNEPVAILCNERGLRLGMEPNRNIKYDSGMTSMIVGPALIVGIDGEIFSDLRPEDLEKFYELYKKPCSEEEYLMFVLRDF